MPDPRKIDLAYAYRILAHLGLDDHTYTHLSVRAEDPSCFYIYPFGQRFEEVTAVYRRAHEDHEQIFDDAMD